MSGSTRAGVHAVLYVRSLVPRGVQTCQEEVVEGLRELRDRGDITFTVEVYGARAPATRSDADTDLAADVLDRVDAFERWADRNGHSLGSLFERRTIQSSITGESREVLVLPAMLLAEYERGDLRFVSPCVVDDTLRTVRDRVDTLLERGAPADVEPPVVGPSEDEREPDRKLLEP